MIRPPGRNVAPPSEPELRNSGWQYEGEWHGFTGTAVGPHSFITAAHVRGYPGEAFVFHDKNYRAIDATVITGTDLCVWRVAGELPLWAPLYEGRSEVGRDVVMFGRGTDRGAPIRVGSAIHGWANGGSDERLSWGRSWVLRTLSAQQGNTTTPYGDGFSVPFDADAGPDAGCVSGGDSGGGVFLKDTDGQWKLAGVIYGVENGFYQSADQQSGIAGVLFDTRGLYRRVANGKILEIPPEGSDPYPMQSIISRISTNAVPIQQAIRTSSLTIARLQRLALLVLLPAVLVCGVIGVALWRLRKRGSAFVPDDESIAIDTDP